MINIKYQTAMARRLSVLIKVINQVRLKLDDASIDDWDAIVCSECEAAIDSPEMNEFGRHHINDYKALLNVFSSILDAESPSGRLFTYASPLDDIAKDLE